MHTIDAKFTEELLDLEKYSTIVFYSEEHPIPTTFKDKIIPPYTFLNLSVDKILITKIKDFFKLEKLPAIYSNGSVYYENDEMRKTTNDTRVLKIIQDLLDNNNNMIFIKGTPSRPECKFTRQLLEILDVMKIEVGFFNIFTDERMRSVMKEINNFETFPQIYLNKRFIGGLDNLKAMRATGKLQDFLNN